MSANTNGFNYYSDYQGHGGAHVVIIVILFLGIILLGSSFKKDEPVNDYRDDYDTNMNRDSDTRNNIDNDINSDQNNIDSNLNSDNNVDTNSNTSGGAFEIYR